jgi:prephenate dehydrogenase
VKRLTEMTTGILGLGQIGGSLALAFRANSVARKLIGYDRNEEILSVARGQSLIDAVVPDENALIQNANIVILALPIPEILRVLVDYSEILRDKQLVIDTGSVKSPMENEANRAGLTQFVGGHPLAGSEKRGSAGWDGDLFRGRPFFLTGGGRAGNQEQSQASQLVESIGARATPVDPGQHDRMIAVTIHLPHVLAYAQKKLFYRNNGHPNNKDLLRGPSFESATRVTASDPDMVSQMLWHNRKNILNAMDRLRDELAQFERALRSEDDVSLRAEIGVKPADEEKHK